MLTTEHQPDFDSNDLPKITRDHFAIPYMKGQLTRRKGQPPLLADTSATRVLLVSKHLRYEQSTIQQYAVTVSIQYIFVTNTTPSLMRKPYCHP